MANVCRLETFATQSDTVRPYNQVKLNIQGGFFSHWYWQLCFAIYAFSTNTFEGFQGSTTPRLGDGAVISQVIGAAARGGLDHLGSCNLYRGTADIGTCRVVDSGYINLDRNTRAANERIGNPSLQEWCQEVKWIQVLSVEVDSSIISSENHYYSLSGGCSVIVPFSRGKPVHRL